MELMPLVEKLYPLHRTLVSDGTEEALSIVGKHMPEESNYFVERWTTEEKVWTWQVPKKYVVHEAYLELENGTRVADFKNNPLHLVSYSVPFVGTLTWEELEPHLYYSINRPNAIPWVFKFYEKDWGFCISKTAFDRLPRDAKYRVVIQSEFQQSTLGVGVGCIGGSCAEEILICTHICHPYQANDDIAGVVTAVEVANRLATNPLPADSMNVRFIFVPETIGSICYLSRHASTHLRAGIFIEMVGNNNIVALQHSRQGNHLIDRIAKYCLKKETSFREGSFRQVVGNDEMVINGPGVDIPCISVSRSPYPEYHTSDDTPGILSECRLQEAASIITEIVRIFATNYIPVRRFIGPVFLSGYGLWVDYRANKKLNAALEDIMLCMEGQHSVFDIAEGLGLDYWETKQYIDKFLEYKLVSRMEIPKDFLKPEGRFVDRYDMVDR